MKVANDICKKMKYILSILLFCIAVINNNHLLSQGSLLSEFDNLTIGLAARNITYQIQDTTLARYLIINSYDKREIANSMVDDLTNRGLENVQISLSKNFNSSEQLKKTIESWISEWAMLFLISPKDASFLFETVGRPDIGIYLPETRIFCDWLIKSESLVRIYGVNREENIDFQNYLKTNLKNSTKIRITSKNGTDLKIRPRDWNTLFGEIYTAPIENKSNGTIVIDGSAYYGPPKIPISLQILNGRVTNMSELNKNDKQQAMVLKDLSTDSNSNVLAEFGIGTNLGANILEYVMESEQARGTCHFGFGLNKEYGGENYSSIHIDYVILNPTIVVDGNVICKDGVYISYELLQD